MFLMFYRPNDQLINQESSSTQHIVQKHGPPIGQTDEVSYRSDREFMTEAQKHVVDFKMQK